MLNSEIARTTQPRRIARVPPWIAIGLLFIIWLLGWKYKIGGAWIHLLPALVLLVLLIRMRVFLSENIEAEEDVILKWDPQQSADSLDKICSYVIREASKSIRWYWKAKRSKALPSQLSLYPRVEKLSRRALSFPLGLLLNGARIG